MKLLQNYQDRIHQRPDVETAKKLALEAGITTEKEMQEKTNRFYGSFTRFKRSIC